jgi:hypothetical protein
VAVALLVAIATVGSAETAHAVPEALSPSKPLGPPSSFIAALAQIPEATKVLASARASMAEARTRAAGVRSVAAAAATRLDQATAVLREASNALVRADDTAAEAQERIDDTARAMYTSGGGAPTLVDVLLTADSELGLARSLVTRQYLASAGARFVAEALQAEEQRRAAAAARAVAAAHRDVEAAAASAAQESARAAEREVAVVRAAVDAARSRHRTLMRMTRVDHSSDYGRIRTCGDWLTRLLSTSGFEGEDLREAWAIVMRESGGREDAVSVTGDLGLFQINTDTWRDQDWFDRDLLLKRKYNSKVAYQLSRGGQTWYSWGLDGHGRPDPGAYEKAGWSAERISSHIVVPYIQWYARYPCRPAYEEDLTGQVPLLSVPTPKGPLQGGGQLPGIENYT